MRLPPRQCKHSYVLMVAWPVQGTDLQCPTDLGLTPVIYAYQESIGGLRYLLRYQLRSAARLKGWRQRCCSQGPDVWRRIPPNSLLPFVRVPRVIKEIWWYGKSCEWRTCPGSSTCWCGLSPSTLLVKADLWIWRDCRIKHERSVKQWDSLRSLLWFNGLRWGSSIMSWMTWWWWPTPNCSTTKNNSWWSFPRAYPTSLREAATSSISIGWSSSNSRSSSLAPGSCPSSGPWSDSGSESGLGSGSAGAPMAAPFGGAALTVVEALANWVSMIWLWTSIA